MPKKEDLEVFVDHSEVLGQHSGHPAEGKSSALLKLAEGACDTERDRLPTAARDEESHAVVTMQQVADRARVSISTVSFVVNDTKPVTPATRERVLQAIADLGYRRNSMARALASRKTHILALIYPMLDHRYPHRFVESAATTAAEHGYNLVLWPLHSNNVTSEITSLIQAALVDGVLLMEVQLEDERVAHLRTMEAPFTLIGRTRELDGIDYVDIDFERTVETAIDDLAALGHRDLTLVVEDVSGTPLAGYAPPFRAEQAFGEIVSARRLHGRVFRIGHRAREVTGFADRLLREAPATTAVLGMHDDVNLALVNTLPHRGIDVPGDMSIVSLATARSLSELTEPALTVYEAPGAEVGRAAAEALIARLEGRDAPRAQVLIPCPLHPGGTVAAVRPRARSSSGS
ncbi:LacI family DNA-binding transcriptional regulator [Curtobacterium ammoniigenes]|uniref:LacI family DNA-binding transcriptional regulator n=1 Tax=Curtobacterium ammoniigenes TaxID=395387 RepID=UPI0014708407|nr:LacI family DNA-binding transcriptional regulator [Curtobacterium ammoniigenes]